MASKSTSSRTEETFTIGRSRFERISAVEGIKTSAKIQKMFAEFDLKKLTPDQRRKAIRETFVKKA
jgi:hypothetical protein